MELLIEDTFLPKALTWTMCKCRYCSEGPNEHQPTWVCKAFYFYWKDAAKSEKARIFSTGFNVVDWNKPTMRMAVQLNHSKAFWPINSEEGWNTFYSSLISKGTLNDSNNQPERQDSTDPSLAGSVPF